MEEKIKEKKKNKVNRKKIVMYNKMECVYIPWGEWGVDEMADFLPLLLLNCFIRYFILFLQHVLKITCLY